MGEGRRKRRRVGSTDDWEQLELFALDDVLGEGGGLKALRLDGYAAARSRGTPEMLQQAPFSYSEALYAL
jgi:hypothetical protein